MLRQLDEETISRIKDCKRRGFPICLEESFLVIFKDTAGKAIVERIIKRLGLSYHDVDSGRQVWETYDLVLKEISIEMGEDLSKVLEYQSIREMESMPGCTGCPLYRREACKEIQTFD